MSSTLLVQSVALVIAVASSGIHAAANNSALYYITPSPTTLCPGNPCFTLSEYAAYRNLNQTSDDSKRTTLVFLAGTHTLKDRGIRVRDVASFVLLGDSTSLPALKSVITCLSRSGPVVGFDFFNVTNLILSSLTFTGCGHETLVTALVYVESVALFSVQSCSFKDNSFTSALLVRYGSASISDSSFTNNTSLGRGSALLAGQSCVEFVGSNCFADNVALRRCSVVDAQNSQIVFNATSSPEGVPTTIVNNSVQQTKGDTRNNCCGTSVCALENSRLTVYGASKWTQNFFSNPTRDKYLTTNAWGGALFAEYSPVSFEDGEHVFTGNSAGAGGAIFTTFRIAGNLRMENNSAFTGGALYTYVAFGSIESRAEFSGNQQLTDEYSFTRGGSIYLGLSVITFGGNVSVHNSFAYTGAVSLLQSAVFFTGT